jgi:hypothetical protein
MISTRRRHLATAGPPASSDPRSSRVQAVPVADLVSGVLYRRARSLDWAVIAARVGASLAGGSPRVRRGRGGPPEG